MFLGPKFWQSVDWSALSLTDLQGFSDVAALFSEDRAVSEIPDIKDRFSRLASFVTPIEQRYQRYFRWHRLSTSGKADAKAHALAAKLRREDPALFRTIQQAERIAPVIGDSQECPVTHIELPQSQLQQLRKGELLWSPYTNGVLLYWKPDFDEGGIVS